MSDTVNITVTVPVSRRTAAAIQHNKITPQLQYARAVSELSASATLAAIEVVENLPSMLTEREKPVLAKAAEIYDDKTGLPVYEINIVCEDHSTVTLKVRVNTTVRQVKSVLEQDGSIAPVQQRLTFAGRHVHDPFSLGYYSIYGDSTLHLTVAGADELPCVQCKSDPAGTFQVIVRELTGQETALEVQETLTVNRLKDLVYQRIYVSVSNQRLIYGGKSMQDQHALAHYGLREGSHIHLVPTLRGS